jgi:ADP-ribose pyrophosphatase
MAANEDRDDDVRVLCNGRHIQLVARGGWEFVRRKNVSGIVGIVAVTDGGKLILVEQARPPVGKRVIEIPAGLAGDVESARTEDLADAARRELLEETGYDAARMERLADGTASAGITDEVITLFRATGLRRVSSGGGDASEKIAVHEVPLNQVEPWLEQRVRNDGALVDLKVFTALHFALGS